MTIIFHNFFIIIDMTISIINVWIGFGIALDKRVSGSARLLVL